MSIFETVFKKWEKYHHCAPAANCVSI
uniref:Uncharacterized protein n=1 Tax=Arundo donax TaxID=35708 RepID=A0A0A9AKL7_ARUDO